MRLPMIKRDETNVINRPVRSLIDDFLKNAFSEPSFDETKLMAMDVVERDGEYVLKADLPGIKKKDIKVYVDGDNLVIEAHRTDSKEEKNRTMYRCERYSGDYRRVFSIPENWDYEKIKAAYDDGVLTLQVPKRKLQPEKEIAVK